MDKGKSHENGMENGHTNENSYKEFQSAAIVCNNSYSCTVGKTILAEGGSVVDAAIASMLTLGVISFQSAGIGGGFLMVYYDAETGEDHVIDGRAVAPLESNEEMFLNDFDDHRKSFGRLSIAIPGEIRGYWKAHQKFGKLPWSRLFEPATEAAENGFEMTSSCENWVNVWISKTEGNVRLRNFLKRPDGTYKRAGDIIKRPEYAETLRTIAREGGEAFYIGSLTDSILEDIHDGFGPEAIITKEDFVEYKAKSTKALRVKLDDSKSLVTAPAPSGGPALAMLINILKGYNFTPGDLRDEKLLTYHRMVEAMKFAYCQRSSLGDPEFNTKVLKTANKMISEERCEKIRKRIDDHQTHSREYYYYDEKLIPLPEDHGTAQMGIIGENGSAVAMTSTVNQPFGSNVLGKRTGIIFNDQMAIFSTPGGDEKRFYNYIEPGKRCLTATCPTIILQKTGDKKSEVKFVIGGSGGSRIITSTANVIMQVLWFNKSIDEAVRAKRLHHSWHPNQLRFQRGFDEEVLLGLKNKGHELEIQEAYVSTVQALMRLGDGRIAAKCDDRRGGSPDGF